MSIADPTRQQQARTTAPQPAPDACPAPDTRQAAVPGTTRGPDDGPGTTALLDAALAYAARGWHVIPLHDVTTGVCSCAKGGACGKDSGKHPRLDDWGTAGSTAPATLTAWWTQWPDAHLGILTGHRSRLAVLDIDPRNGGDVALEDFLHHHGPLPETPLVLSGGGGQHYYFACEEDLPGCKLAPGLDLQLTGQQVVAPPSAHRSGRCYAWEASSHPDDVPLAPLPPWILAHARAKQTAQAAGVDLPDTLPTVALTALPVSPRIKYLIRTGEDPETPARYPSRSEAGFAVISACVQAQVDAGTIAAVLLDPHYPISAYIWERKNPKSPFYVQQIRQWLAKEIARAQAKHRTGETPGPGREELHKRGNGETPGPGPAPVRFHTIPARALQAKVLPPLQWAIPGVLPAGGTLFIGRGKDGKSLAMWNICLAIATGGMAFGAFPVEQGDVLYLALEDGERRAQQRLNDQLAYLGSAAVPDNLDLVLWDAPRMGEGFEGALTTWLDEHPPARLVVIDILEKVRPRRTRNGSVYADDYAASAPLTRIAQERGVAVVIVHHSNKSKPEDFRDSSSGSNGLLGGCDTLWRLSRIAGKADAMLSITGRDVHEQELAMQFQDGFWTVLGNAEDYRLSKESREVLDALTQAAKPLTPKQLATHLSIPVGTVRVRLKRMLDRGEVLNHGDGYIPRPPPSSPPPSPPSSPPERERERDGRSMDERMKEHAKKYVTPVMGVMDETGVTGVTLGQKDPELQEDTEGGVTLDLPISDYSSMSYGYDGVSDTGDTGVTGVTGKYQQGPPPLIPLTAPDCLPPPCAHPETRAQRMEDGSTLVRCTTCHRVVRVTAPDRRD